MVTNKYIKKKIKYMHFIVYCMCGYKWFSGTNCSRQIETDNRGIFKH